MNIVRARIHDVLKLQDIDKPYYSTTMQVYRVQSAVSPSRTLFVALGDDRRWAIWYADGTQHPYVYRSREDAIVGADDSLHFSRWLEGQQAAASPEAAATRQIVRAAITKARNL